MQQLKMQYIEYLKCTQKVKVIILLQISLMMEKYYIHRKNIRKIILLKKIINNRIYVGDYEAHKDKNIKDGKEPEIYYDVVEPIITRAMWEEGIIMTCKDAEDKKSKYLYYHCNKCGLNYNEDEGI